MKVAVDYNAPLLTLAALNVMNTSNDPVYTSLQAGAYQRPSGHPCDAVYSCSLSHLSKGAKIAIGVVITIVGLALLGGLFYIVRRRQATNKALQ
jgi:endoglucanase